MIAPAGTLGANRHGKNPADRRENRVNMLDNKIFNHRPGTAKGEVGAGRFVSGGA